MLKDTYLKTRGELIAKAQGFIDAGDLGDDYKAAIREITDLDDKFEAEAKESANLAALKSAPLAQDPFTEKDERPFSKMNGIAEPTDIFASIEYRTAFADYVQNGTPISERFFAEDANTKTTDVGYVIPTTIMERIVEKMEEIGTIYNMVTKTSYKGGLSIPTSSLKPTATWVAEGAGSDKQKKTIGHIVFGAYKLRCAISMSLEVQTMALPVFETVFVAQVSEAMIKAIEAAIISGDGSGKPKGILAETPISGHVIEVAASAALSYDNIIDLEAAIPVEYENGVSFAMTKKTWAAVLKLKDTENHPIAWEGFLNTGRPTRNLLGYPVVLNNYMTSLGDTLTADTPVIFGYNFADYILNSNLDITVKQYEDNETEDQITKAVMLADGKAIDLNSLVVLKKKYS